MTKTPLIDNVEKIRLRISCLPLNVFLHELLFTRIFVFYIWAFQA